jgi:diguanylate cyclase (GGDEF)-like protein
MLARNICTLLKAEACLVLRYEEEGKKLRPAGSHNLSSDYKNLASKDIAIARTACEQRRMMVIKDIRKLYRKTEKNILEKLKREGIASLVSAPMVYNDTVIGSINVYFSRSIQRFNMKEALNLFAILGASALLHGRTKNTLDQETRIMSVIKDTGALLASSFAMEDIVHMLLKTGVEIADAQSGALILLDEKEKLISSAYEYIRSTDKTHDLISTARLDEGISLAVLRAKKAVLVPDMNIRAGADPFTVKKDRGAVAGIPLLVRGRTIGILFINFHIDANLTERNIGYVSALADQSAVALDNIFLSRKVSREDKETALLYDVSQSLITTLDFDQLLNNVLQHLKDTFGFLNASVLLVDEEKQALYTHSSIVYSREDRDLRLRIGLDGITGHVAKTKRMYYSPDVNKDTYYVPGIDNTRSEACFPLLTGDHLIGVLDVESSEVNGFSQDVIRLLSSLSAQIAIAIDNARLYEETKKLSLTDSLTALSNRRSFELFVEAEIRRAERYRRTFVIMMIDLDNFKNYNDKYGHMAGDIVLQKLSKMMKGIIRDVDFLCRYGGDEFVAILPETDASFALDVAERMRKKIAAQKIQPRITLSIGIASFPHDARDKSRLTDLADQACYDAKQRGGNRVIFSFKPKNKK